MNKRTIFAVAAIIACIVIGYVLYQVLTKEDNNQSIIVPNAIQLTQSNTTESTVNIPDGTQTPANSPEVTYVVSIDTPPLEPQVPVENTVKLDSSPFIHADYTNYQETTGQINGNNTHGQYAVYHNGLYYYTDTRGGTSNGAIMELNLKTGEKRTIIESAGAFLNVYDGYLYYADITMGALNGGPLFRVNLKSLEKEVIENKYIYNLYIYNEKLIYSTEKDGKFICDLNGSNKYQILPNGTGNIHLKGDALIYYDRINQTINSIDINTREILLLVNSEKIKSFITSDKSIFYIKYDTEQLIRYDFENKESRIIVSDLYEFNVYGDNIIYSTNEGIEEKEDFTLPRNLYIADLDGNEIKKLEEKGNIGTIVGDRMYYWDCPEDQDAVLLHMDLQ